MSHKFLQEASFHSLLNKIDQELSDNAHEEPCSHCGGRLHQSNYPRSPFGIALPFRKNYEERLSLCCGKCRKRTTPPSIRFFGRRRFPAPLILLISILTLGINDKRLSQVKRHFGITVSKSTWDRWRRWWRESFMTTAFWQQARGLLPPRSEIIQGPFPRELFRVFQGKMEERMLFLLHFMTPLTAGVLRAL